MVYKLPEELSFEEGAALPVNYATAQAGLVVMGGLKQGERVLIHAAAGGVGIAATQIAKRIGAEVFGTASASKHDAIREQGVDHAIDYRSQDFAEVGLRGELLFGVAHPLAGDPHAGGLALQGAGGWRDCSFGR